MSKDEEQLPDKIIEIESLKRKYGPKNCECGIHAKYAIDQQNMTVTCMTCNNRVEAFVALLNITDTTSRYREEVEKLNELSKQITNYKPRRKVLKNIEKLYDKKGGFMETKPYPICPACHEPFYLEEIQHRGSWDASIFTERRIKERIKKQNMEEGE